MIAGSARGIRLVGSGEGTRPLGDRVKQTLFAILEPRLRDRPFLDLYAGSGAAGIEALSRGASAAVFVESDGRAVDVILRNLETTGLAGPAAEVVRRRVADFLDERRAGEPFTAVVVDPPYESPRELDRTLATIERHGPGGVLAADGVLVAKHFWRTQPPATRLLRSDRRERFGETMLTFYRWADPAAAAEVAP